jgi:pilus assembly protein CpaF
MIPREVFEESLLHFLGPVRRHLEDATVSEVMINGPDQVFIERGGILQKTRDRFDGPDSLITVLRNAAQFVGKHIDEEYPIVEAHLPDGSRLQGVLPPLANNGPFICIRRFFQSSLTRERLIASGTVTEEAALALEAMVKGKANVLVAGGTGTGKTSMLNWLTSFVSPGERIGIIEDTKEVQVRHEHVFQMTSRPADQDGRGAVTIRDLFRASLRMRPDRIIVGEIRGGEALDIVQAMVSGHGGCLATLHASHPRDTLTRLETMAMMSDIEMPLTALRLQIASGVNAIVQVSRRRDGKRVITHISEVLGYNAEQSRYEIQDLFTRDYRDADDGGTLLRTGVTPQFAEVLEEHGVPWPFEELTDARRLS